MSRRDNHQAALDSIEAFTRMLRTEVPDTVTHLEWLMPDGLAAHPYDGEGHSHSTDSPVERTVLKREPDNTQLAAIGEELDAAAKVLRNLLRDCRDIRKLTRKIGPTDGEPVRCDGGAGREGYLIPKAEGGWSTPDCDNVPDASARTCPRCRQAASRWTRNQGDAA